MREFVIGIYVCVKLLELVREAIPDQYEEVDGSNANKDVVVLTHDR